jgi:hypothetical protein
MLLKDQKNGLEQLQCLPTLLGPTRDQDVSEEPTITIWTIFKVSK